MTRRLVTFIGLALFITCAHGVYAQLSGTYTCANGNPGNAFDYGDIGDFFNDLETFGVGGAVVLDIYDDGGPFTSNWNYQLGANYNPPPAPSSAYATPVLGLSASNTLTIRAATGETPEIISNGARSRTLSEAAALSFDNISYTTIEGLTLRDGGGNGIFWLELKDAQTPMGKVQHVRIARCRIYNMWPTSINSAVQFVSYGDPIGNVTIENNMFWNGIFYGVSALRPGVEWVVRHNTVLAPGGRAFVYGGSTIPWSNIDNNIVFVGNGRVLQADIPPVNADGNVMWFPGGAVNQHLFTWAQWQASGRDLNGLNADPLLVNTTPGFEDLRLQPGSPARDLLTVASVPVDVFGNPRPMGVGGDSGAHEYPTSAIEVEYSSTPIANTGAAQVGNVLLPGGMRSFIIRNPHAANLDLTGTPTVTLAPGSNLTTATVQGQPAQTSIPMGGSTTFTLYIEPAAAGPFDLLVTIPNNTPNSNPFTFTINGVGITNAPARGDPAPGSSFAGVPGGPYYYALDPGAPLVDAEIVLTDLEGDTITVVTVGQINPPTGVTMPAVPPPGHPITLAWTGVMDASNPPGLYQYQVHFHDAVNGTPVSVTLFITNNDLPPTHTLANATAGDGSAGNPYMAAFTEGDDGSNTLDLATLADPNPGQSVTLAGFNPGTGNPPGGVGFAFTASGVLTIAPAGTLLPGDVGIHTYTVQITDGTNTVNVHVQISVAALPPPPTPITITTTTLPDGVVGQNYAQTIQLTGGSGGFVFSVHTGTLPTGLLLNASTGEITGKPTTTGTETFTIHVIDAATATATQPYTLNVQPAPTPPPINNDPGSDGDSSCSATNGAGWWWLLLALGGARLGRRRQSVG